MPTRSQPIADAGRSALWTLHEIGRELRVARVHGGKRLREVARLLGVSTSQASRIERGRVRSVAFVTLARYAACVGLKIWVKTFPGGRRLLDAPQLELLERVKARSHRSCRWETEVPMPIEGDLRAADARVSVAGCVIVMEIYSRIADYQAQSRAAQLKKRDLHADRLILVIAGTSSNRRALRDARVAVADAFPLRTKAVLRALARGVDPGADGIVLI
jgi:transcriptional regulator with XRE-family HTH domain